MINACVWTVGILAVAYFIFTIYDNNKRREREAELFRKQQEEQIAARQKAIEDKAKQSKEEVDEYYKKRAEWLANRKRGNKSPTGSGN